MEATKSSNKNVSPVRTNDNAELRSLVNCSPPVSGRLVKECHQHLDGDTMTARTLNTPPVNELTPMQTPRNSQEFVEDVVVSAGSSSPRPRFIPPASTTFRSIPSELIFATSPRSDSEGSKERIRRRGYKLKPRLRRNLHRSLDLPRRSRSSNQAILGRGDCSSIPAFPTSFQDTDKDSPASTQSLPHELHLPHIFDSYQHPEVPRINHDAEEPLEKSGKFHLRPIPKRTPTTMNSTEGQLTPRLAPAVSKGKFWSPGLFSAFERIPRSHRPKK